MIAVVRAAHLPSRIKPRCLRLSTIYLKVQQQIVIFKAWKYYFTAEWLLLLCLCCLNLSFYKVSLQSVWANSNSALVWWTGHVACKEQSRNTYRVLVWRPEGKRSLGKLSCRWKDNINMDMKEVGFDARNWMDFAEEKDQWRAYVSEAMNFRVS